MILARITGKPCVTKRYEAVCCGSTCVHQCAECLPPPLDESLRPFVSVAPQQCSDSVATCVHFYAPVPENKPNRSGTLQCQWHPNLPMLQQRVKSRDTFVRVLSCWDPLVGRINTCTAFPPRHALSEGYEQQAFIDCYVCHS